MKPFKSVLLRFLISLPRSGNYSESPKCVYFQQGLQFVRDTEMLPATMSKSERTQFVSNNILNGSKRRIKARLHGDIDLNHK